MELATSFTCTHSFVPGPMPAERESLSFRFLDSPHELRIQIYEYLVVVGKIFYSPGDIEIREGRHFHAWKQYRIPELSLLRVCKQLQKEAEYVYHTQNMFILLPYFKCRPPLMRLIPEQTPVITNHYRSMFSQRGLENITNLSVDFTSRNFFPTMMTASEWEANDRANRHRYDDAPSHHARLTYVHARAVKKTTLWWTIATSALGSFPSKLRYLEMDFTNANCPLGCCCPLEALRLDFSSTSELKCVKLLGLRSGEEALLRGKIVDALKLNDNDALKLKDDETLEKKIKIISDPAEDPWVTWRDVGQVEVTEIAEALEEP